MLLKKVVLPQPIILLEKYEIIYLKFPYHCHDGTVSS